MRHTIWVTRSGVTTPLSPDELSLDPATATGPERATERAPELGPERAAEHTRVRASTRLWTRSLLAFVALVLLLAALIELVAYLVTGDSLTMPFGVAAASIATAILCTLAVTREQRR